MHWLGYKDHHSVLSSDGHLGSAGVAGFTIWFYGVPQIEPRLENVRLSAKTDWLGQSEWRGMEHNHTDILSRGYFAVTQRPKPLPVLALCSSSL